MAEEKDPLNQAAAFYQNMQMANSVAHQQAMQNLQLVTTAKITQMIVSGQADNGGADLSQLMTLLQGMQNSK